MHGTNLKKLNSGMPAATVSRKSNRNSTHRRACKKGYILTVKVEKMAGHRLQEICSKHQKRQYISSNALQVDVVVLVSYFGVEQTHSGLDGKAGNLRRTVVSLASEFRQFKREVRCSNLFDLKKFFDGLEEFFFIIISTLVERQDNSFVSNYPNLLTR